MRPISSKFSWTYWYWTMPEENLFELTPEEWYLYRLFIDEANK